MHITEVERDLKEQSEIVLALDVMSRAGTVSRVDLRPHLWWTAFRWFTYHKEHVRFPGNHMFYLRGTLVRMEPWGERAGGRTRTTARYARRYARPAGRSRTHHTSGAAL
jgi:hypothetical protein